MEPIDPTKEIIGATLRNVVEYCIEFGRIQIGWHGGQDRMAERNITGGQVVAALRGALTTDSCVSGVWRYAGRRNGIAAIFTFTIDDDGNRLIVVTPIRED